MLVCKLFALGARLLKSSSHFFCIGFASDLYSTLLDAHEAAWSEFFSVIFLPFQEHQAFESMSFHQLSNFLPLCIT